MATERQIAANRRNAGKSTGPRSRAGKQRARGNAYQHGLTTGLISSAAFAQKIERLARKIAGNTEDEIILEHARSAAYAEYDLARVRRVKVALIERCSVEASATVPADKFERTAEAIRHVLPELAKLDRYESRAVARRDRAIRQIVKERSRGNVYQNK